MASKAADKRVVIETSQVSDEAESPQVTSADAPAIQEGGSVATDTKQESTNAVSDTKDGLFLDQLQVDVTGTIVVMVGRKWDVNAVTGRYLSTDFVVSDAKGNAIHCTARGNVAHNFLRLKEGGIYFVKNFLVHANKPEFRIRNSDSFMIEFDGATIIRKAFVKADGFVRYPFQMVDFDGIVPTDNKYLIDVAGYITNVGRTTYQKLGSRNLDFYLANHRGQTIRVTLWGALGDVLIEKKAKQVGMCPIVLSSVSAKNYNNKVYLSSSSSTMIFDDPEIPAVNALIATMPADGQEPKKNSMAVDHFAPRQGTLENLLMWARNRKNDTATFHCKVKISNVRTRKGWNFPSCGGENCKKGATRKQGQFWCDSCNRTIMFPVLRYMLELDVTDDTGSAVVVLFDEPATTLVGCSADSIVSYDDESSDDRSILPPALANLIGTVHTLEIKSHTYYEYGTFESFTCWTIVQTEEVVDAASSSTLDADVALNNSKQESLAQDPSVPTPYKPTNGKPNKRVDIEDSDCEDAHDLLASAIGRKKKGVVIEDSDADGECAADGGVKKKDRRRSCKKLKLRYTSDEE